MHYPFENLDPEQFQAFCQALLTREFPDVQCFPIGQPDGGRDAISFFVEHRELRDFLVYQIKFVREPHKIAAPHKWLEAIVKDEAPKVQKLIPKGAKRYILLTNVAGTAHPEVGSIDEVQTVLANLLPVPATCWWKDDLSRRLDHAWDLKWSYPALMTGPDLLRVIIENGLTEERERRSGALRAFVRDQYRADHEVRFKQVELQNRLLDLFIDVPLTARLSPEDRKSRGQQRAFIYFSRFLRPTSDMEDADIPAYLPIQDPSGHDIPYYREDRPRIGAATALLHPLIQRQFSRLVLEGAPGQGKSTIAQYVCQVHRMRILGETADLSLVPPQHADSPIRLPFKVDLRDLAAWLGRKNPFSPEATEIPSDQWHKSLESFLAAQIRYYSGGMHFTVTDLATVARLSSVLLVFDGLDEVADIGRRGEVVDEILKGVNRLAENTASLQVIVTSRPAAFANSPGLPHDLFPHLQLDSLTRPLIDQYAEKWLDARQVRGRDRAEFKQTLKDKLDQPHLRDAAPPRFGKKPDAVGNLAEPYPYARIVSTG